jgi:hypothetical protein
MYNARIVSSLIKVIAEIVPEQVNARKIALRMMNGDRIEEDEGPVVVARDMIIRSLDPNVGKIWPCERLLQLDGTAPKIRAPMYFADRHPKLNVERWAESGRRAPYPKEEGESWLDLKGGFIGVKQPKDPYERAISIHTSGWT